MKAFARAAELDPKHVDAVMMVGVMHADAGEDASALEWFTKAIELDPNRAKAHGNIGQIYQNQGKSHEALAAFEKAVAAAPGDWRYQSKLVQVNQALRRIDDRDHALAVLKDMWDDDKIDQPLFCREQFEVAGKKVQAYEYFELRGERAMRYSFIVMKPDGKEPDYRITLGSRDKLFHLNGDYPNNERLSFGTFKIEPTYEATRIRIVQVLEGKLKPGGEQNLDIEVEAGE
jgi:tetratricopeptide (TPR) repeat protein